MLTSAITEIRRRSVRRDYASQSARRRYELIDGRLYAIPAPGVKCQTIALRLASALIRHAEARDLGRLLTSPCRIILSRHTEIQPDIFFVTRERTGLIGATNLHGRPDLIIEIPPREHQTDGIVQRRRTCAQSGVGEYWIVSPLSETVEVRLWSEIGYVSLAIMGKPDRLSSPLFPDLSLSLSTIFT